ncbi:penicillin-binding transpeptidase domain-containing protein [Dictyobacter kobayashii]|uniref:Penicillin-binding protein n=1 Tax=Dictyobacter kobayashii TaxID=2014872 RepID=A0A402AM89_9CHLR|nr:penicillin-binding transpeptidase domain-containing protein [Dictyobacter kobayashii]GCE20159.1 penicillin-binding protein [Dictyobacter kobayashii]
MNINASIRKLTIIFVVMFVAVSGCLVYWQAVRADEVTASPHNARICSSNNVPLRGNIYDRNGILLAYSVRDPHVCGGYIRHYTDPSLAGLIGYYVPGGIYPATGLEAQYNDILNGLTGQTALNNLINKTMHTAPIGNNIYLTIDDRIQKIVAQDFNNYTPDPTGTAFANHTYPTFPTNKGSAVVTDPHTGEILALLSSPGYDPNKMVQTLAHSLDPTSYYNQLIKSPDNPLLYRPTQGLYSPGSTFKTVTLLSALDSGATTLDQEWNMQDAYNPWHVAATADSPGTTVTGDNLGYLQYVFHFPVSTEFGFANSDNIMFAHMGANEGEQKWLDYTKRMYFDQAIPSDFPIAKSHVLQADGNLNNANFVNDVYGQGVDFVTPMQMSLVDNTVANNGVLMRPTVIKQITDSQKNQLQTFAPQQLNTVISGDAAYKTRVAMNAVTTCGSAWHITEDNLPQQLLLVKLVRLRLEEIRILMAG